MVSTDFVLGCRKQLISDPGRKKFGKLFGIDLTQWDEDEFPRTNLDVFKGEAFWRNEALLSESPNVQITSKDSWEVKREGATCAQPSRAVCNGHDSYNQESWQLVRKSTSRLVYDEEKA
jgi:hypothetical protein